MKKLVMFMILALLFSVTSSAVNLGISVQDGPATTNPFRARSVWSWKAIGPILEGLASRDINHKIMPWLAESWEFEQEGKLTVWLKKDIKWHDGTNFTAEDVVFTYNLIKYFDFPLLSYRLDPVNSVRMINEYIVVFDLNMEFLEGKESPILYSDLLMQFIIQKDQWEPVFEEAKKADNSIEKFWKWMPDKLQGTGPFEFNVWRKGIYVYLTAFTDWHMTGKIINGKKLGPYIDGILLKVYRSTDTAVLALKSGEVDYVGWPLQKGYADSLANMRGIIISSNKANGFFYFAPNLRKQPWDDIAFRRAIDTIMDRDFIVKRILQGQGEALYAVVPPGNAFWHNPNLKPDALENRLDEAREILAQAGYSWNDRGRLIMPNGEIVARQILTSPPADYDPLRFYAAQCIQRWMSQLGIDVRVRPISFAEIVTRVFDRQDFDCFILGWGLGIDPDYLRVFYASRFSQLGGYNSYGYHSREFDKLAKQAMLEADRDRRQRLIYKMQEVLRKDLPVYTLYWQEIIEVRNDRFIGWHNDVGGIGNLFSYILIKEA